MDTSQNDTGKMTHGIHDQFEMITSLADMERLT